MGLPSGLFGLGRPDASGMKGRSVRVLTIIPTYNERESLPTVITRLRAAVPDAHVLIADDNSPDGTGAMADEMAARDASIHVLHRARKEGLGPAYLAGFAWGLEHGYDVLVEMDADCSHQPEQLPLLLDSIERGADMAIGSRYVPGGRTENWPLQRQLISRGGNLYSRILLGTSIHDITGGFRAYRDTTLRALDLDSVQSRGYCFRYSSSTSRTCALSIRHPAAVPDQWVYSSFGPHPVCVFKQCDEAREHWQWCRGENSL